MTSSDKHRRFTNGLPCDAGISVSLPCIRAAAARHARLGMMLSVRWVLSYSPPTATLFAGAFCRITGTHRRLQSLLLLLLTLLVVPLGASQTMPATGTLEVAFSPADNPEGLITKVIDQAERSIHVQAYVFTSRTIANSLIAAHQRGVKVEVLADAKMNKRGGRNAALPALLKAGLSVAFETDYAAAHNKVLIIDAGLPGCTLVTGSYNFTWSAQNRNAENIIVFRNNCRLVDTYLDNWRRHREKATVVSSLPWRQ